MMNKARWCHRLCAGHEESVPLPITLSSTPPRHSHNPIPLTLYFSQNTATTITATSKTTTTATSKTTITATSKTTTTATSKTTATTTSKTAPAAATARSFAAPLRLLPMRLLQRSYVSWRGLPQMPGY